MHRDPEARRAVGRLQGMVRQLEQLKADPDKERAAFHIEVEPEPDVDFAAACKDAGNEFFRNGVRPHRRSAAPLFFSSPTSS
eukprot:SAG11_NODE_11794_length_738_cov_0.762128_1_plen_81_part_10